ncbi:MAG: hypothetical protein JWP89_1047 [Schlesneria sp.]|nr:hypothetical protein [Schlesneria sp.]
MIATYHSQAFHNQMQSTPWSVDQLYDFELPESSETASDAGLVEPRMDPEDRDRILNHLRHLTVSSLSSFEEIASATTDLHLSSFADVVVRQRTAQQHALYEVLGYSSANDEDEFTESLSALRSLWRGAIWNLEQGHRGLFLEYAERAESLLEEAYLSAAQALGDDPLASEIRDYAIMVCGSRALIEELADSVTRHVPSQFRDSRLQLRVSSQHPSGLENETARRKSNIVFTRKSDEGLVATVRRDSKAVARVREEKKQKWERTQPTRPKCPRRQET